MEKLTFEEAARLNATMVSEDHLIIHAKNVAYAMGAMARRFGEDEEHWMAVGMLHDYDYEKYPDEHLQHTEKPHRAYTQQAAPHSRRICDNLPERAIGSHIPYSHLIE